MHNNINILCDLMRLNQYQSGKLKLNYERYDFARLEQRGGVLYAPYAARGLKEKIESFLFGKRVDLIGKNSVLLRARRGVQFCANGYHCVRAGRYTYYADASGRVISRREFMANK